MRLVLDYIFAAASFAVLITAFGLVATDQLSPISIGPMLAVLVIAALMSRKFRFWLQIRYGKLGFMMPGKRRKLRQATRLSMESEPALSADGTEYLAEDHPRRVVAEALALWRERFTADSPGRALSDDEVRSLYFLHLYADPSGEDRSVSPQKYLRDIHDRTPFLKLRGKIDAWYAARAAEREAYEAWLSEIGGGSMNHLLQSGWKAFLTAQPAADAELWHSIAANTQGIEEHGRLKAAFWILARSQCDKATASDFIRSFVYDRHLDNAVKRRDAETVAAFARVVRRYNADFYKFHSIRSGRYARSIEGYGDADLARDLTRMENKRKLPALPRPNGLLDTTGPAPDKDKREYTSALAFTPTKGLHLRPPRNDWSYA